MDGFESVSAEKNSKMYEFIKDLFGVEHEVVHRGKMIAVWYVSPLDKKTLEDLRNEMKVV